MMQFPFPLLTVDEAARLIGMAPASLAIICTDDTYAMVGPGGKSPPPVAAYSPSGGPLFDAPAIVKWFCRRRVYQATERCRAKERKRHGAEYHDSKHAMKQVPPRDLGAASH